MTKYHHQGAHRWKVYLGHRVPGGKKPITIIAGAQKKAGRDGAGAAAENSRLTPQSQAESTLAMTGVF